tara:strand:- start:18027 stop:18509 length:483 start_codon:yes stop_codon:yes gene_type:complete
MTYIKQKFSLFQTSNAPSAETWTGNDVDWRVITGSTCEINAKMSNPTIVYKFNFYLRDNGEKPILNVKLQKSNDNFSSNIEDMEGYKVSFCGDNSQANDYHRLTCPIFFVIENFNYNYLRLICRPYKNNYNDIKLHRSTDWDNSTSADIYYNPTLIVFEV